MSIKCGFFDSSAGNPREYSASDMSTIFDGIIRDGIFMDVGDRFMCRASTGLNVTVGEGKAWFNHKWIINDGDMTFTLDSVTATQGRIDAVVLEVDDSDAVKNCSVIIKKGTLSSTPTRPSLDNTATKHQYALCYITIPAGATSIMSANIENRVGTSATPFVTGIVQTINTDALLAQWTAQLEELRRNEIANFNAELDSAETAYDKRLDTMNDKMESDEQDTKDWCDQQIADMTTFLNTVIGMFNNDQGTMLAVYDQWTEVNNILLNGFTKGTKTVSDDGSIITTIEDPTKPDASRRLVKTFSNEFSVCETVLYGIGGSILGRLTKTFSSDGKLIESEVYNVYDSNLTRLE